MSRNIRVFAEGALKNVSGLRTWVTAAWKNVSAVRVYKSGAWKQVYPLAAPAPPPPPPVPPTPPPPAPPTFTVACSPLQDSGAASGGTVTSDGTTAVMTGGTAPYTVAWEIASWSLNAAAAPAANSPTNVTTTFTATGVSPDDSINATFRVTARDANGLTAVAQINVTFYRFSHHPGA